MTEAERLRRVEAVCRRDLADLAGLGRQPLGRLGLWIVLGGRVRRFSRNVVWFDRAVGHHGLAAAARALARRYGTEIDALGGAPVPRDGPLLLVANHPGLTDALAVYATSGRPDVLTLARPRPLLRLLPEMWRRVLAVPGTGAGRAATARGALRHLSAGGALLLFPAGHLEPDPALPAGAGAPGVDPFGEWSSGLGTLIGLAARRGIPLRVVPTTVSGVQAAPIRRRFGPLLRLRRGARGRADLAALLQLAFPSLGPTTVCVRYGEPLDAASLVAATPDAAALTEQLKDAVAQVLDKGPDARPRSLTAPLDARRATLRDPLFREPQVRGAGVEAVDDGQAAVQRQRRGRGRPKADRRHTGPLGREHTVERVLDDHAAAGRDTQQLGAAQEDVRGRLAVGDVVAADEDGKAIAQAEVGQNHLDPAPGTRRADRSRHAGGVDPVEQRDRAQRRLERAAQRIDDEAASLGSVVVGRVGQTEPRDDLGEHIGVPPADVGGVLLGTQVAPLTGQDGVGRAQVDRLGVEQDAVQVEDDGVERADGHPPV